MIDAHRPGVTRRDALPRVGPGAAAIVGAEYTCIALHHLRSPVQAPVPGGRIQGVRLRRVREQHVQVRVVAGQDRGPGLARILGQGEAAYLDADPDACTGDDQGPCPRRDWRIPWNAPSSGIRQPREARDFRPGVAIVFASEQSRGLCPGVEQTVAVVADLPHLPALESRR